MMPLLTNRDLLTIIGGSFLTFIVSPLFVVSSMVKKQKNEHGILADVILGCKIFFLLAVWSYWGAVALPFLLSLNGSTALVVAFFVTAFQVVLACILVYAAVQMKGIFDE